MQYFIGYNVEYSSSSFFPKKDTFPNGVDEMQREGLSGRPAAGWRHLGFRPKMAAAAASMIVAAARPAKALAHSEPSSSFLLLLLALVPLPCNYINFYVPRSSSVSLYHPHPPGFPRPHMPSLPTPWIGFGPCGYSLPDLGSFALDGSCHCVFLRLGLTLHHFAVSGRPCYEYYGVCTPRAMPDAGTTAFIAMMTVFD